eukprot:4205378-Prymnesium_polylepis.2
MLVLVLPVIQRADARIRPSRDQRARRTPPERHRTERTLRRQQSGGACRVWAVAPPGAVTVRTSRGESVGRHGANRQKIEPRPTTSDLGAEPQPLAILGHLPAAVAFVPDVVSADPKFVAGALLVHPLAHCKTKRSSSGAGVGARRCPCLPQPTSTGRVGSDPPVRSADPTCRVLSSKCCASKSGPTPQFEVRGGPHGSRRGRLAHASAAAASSPPPCASRAATWRPSVWPRGRAPLR